VVELVEFGAEAKYPAFFIGIKLKEYFRRVIMKEAIVQKARESN
jgi:hypothetical protein